jgi:hypothetical protein
MSTEIITGIVTVVSIAVTGAFKLIEIWWTHRVADKKKSKFNITTIVDCDYKIDVILWEILQLCKADRVFIWRFHNGGHYANGVPMEKLSMTNEVFQSPSNSSIIGQFQQRLISEFGAVIQPLVFQGVYEKTDIVNLKDQVLKSVCEKVASKTLSLFLVRDARNKPIACLTICWSSDNAFTTLDSQKIEIIQKIQEIQPLLNIEK